MSREGVAISGLADVLAGIDLRLVERSLGPPVSEIPVCWDPCCHVFTSTFTTRS